tara:strand:- start:4334 stop:5077 length:744 start_codon:yes stop_codon:yes gene_type:complete
MPKSIKLNRRNRVNNTRRRRGSNRLSRNRKSLRQRGSNRLSRNRKSLRQRRSNRSKRNRKTRQRGAGHFSNNEDNDSTPPPPTWSNSFKTGIKTCVGAACNLLRPAPENAWEETRPKSYAEIKADSNREFYLQKQRNQEALGPAREAAAAKRVAVANKKRKNKARHAEYIADMQRREHFAERDREIARMTPKIQNTISRLQSANRTWSGSIRNQKDIDTATIAMETGRAPPRGRAPHPLLHTTSWYR